MKSLGSAYIHAFITVYIGKKIQVNSYMDIIIINIINYYLL
jgi:hypothetical protein